MTYYSFGPVVNPITRICRKCEKPIRRDHKYIRWHTDTGVLQYEHRDCKHPDEYPWQVAFRQRH